MPTLLKLLIEARTQPGMECTEAVEGNEPQTTTDVPGFGNSRKPEERTIEEGG